ncbi:polysaccharide deacetylase family protein [Bacillus sp. FJAT-49736]|uniref:polysaccharide deacetylase family protein n=1 Tax=Bacillus sp. FJAT-49736 TaxID=2833582 RepID=UPI001BC9CFC7|nr:polysaccharide deacetylase family protein [Bacillus sp. FJAT-49736]MBS4175050.1 polysaccharide deacetylase family protein [Bacillus sp. FJAT-49736]
MFRSKKLLIILATIFTISFFLQSTIIADDNEGYEGNDEIIHGYSLVQPVNVYAGTSREAPILKSYDYNHPLVYHPYSSHWYVAVVSINGIMYKGYINKDDAGDISESQSVKGVTVCTTNVYSSNSIDSSIINSYDKGSIIEYRSYDQDWYMVTVNINEEEYTGYIPINNVETIVNNPIVGSIGVIKSTKVYSKPSIDANIIKSYQVGKLLRYRTFSKNWYEVTSYINGKAQTGYILKKDVNKVLEGYAVKNQAKVYSDTSKNSNILEIYEKGKSLKYRPYNSNWFTVTVNVNGENQTGYILTSDVSPFAPSIQSSALKSPTYLYSQTSRKSLKLKSYKKGDQLKLTHYDDKWYQAIAYIKGKKKTGYIHVKDVGTIPVKRDPGYNIPILMYHQIGEDPQPDEYGRFVTPKDFEEQMEYLKAAGYTPINFDEVQNIKNIKKPIIITFDDGFENNIVAYYILKDLRDETFKPKATFFIIGSEIDENDFLSLEQIKEISDSGIISIQAHTMTHPFFNDSETAGNIDLLKEIKDNKFLLEDITGKKVTAIAYPYGSYNNTVINEVKKYYDFAVTTKQGIANTNDSHYELQRVRVSFNTTLQDFKQLIVK